MPADEEPSYRIAEGGGTPWRDLGRTETHRAPDRNVEITDIRTMAIAGNFTWGLVRVETDAGVHGWGETYRAGAANDMASRLANDLVGENPLDTDRLVELMNQRYTGAGRIGQGAFTAIETACWDIKGKLLDVPVYELLGGKYRDRIPIYCDVHGGESLGAAPEGSEEVYRPAGYARAAREVVDEGFPAMKFDLDVPTGRPEDTAARRLDNDAIAHKVSLIEAVREEIGDGVDLGVDCHWSFTVETATRLGTALEPFDLAWIEDPVPPEEFEAQRRVTESLDTPVLTGENLVTAQTFHRFLSSSAADIIAPDVCKCGGLSEFRRIASLADLHGLPVAPHNIASPLGTVAGAHVAASIPNLLAMEFHARDVPWWEDLVERTGGGGPIIEDGHIDLPEGPGLGVEIDPDIAAAHLTDESECIA